jgi:protein-L-isoaspartate(D-aspartate) O-methyltransferase
MIDKKQRENVVCAGKDPINWPILPEHIDKTSEVPQMKNTKNAYAEERRSMVTKQIESRGIKDVHVLEAMKKVPRHTFVPENMRKFAYNDEPLPIGKGQTISQPYIVAYMTEVLELSSEFKVLEVGTGSGYQAAVLAEIVKDVFTVEIIDELSKNARGVLEAEGYTNIHFRVGDGANGWAENAPYDAIMVTAAPPDIPKALQGQLTVGGRMIVPVGDAFQELVLIVREKRKFRKKNLLPVRFVPLVKPH